MILDKSLKSRMALTTAVLAVIGGYSRRAYAAGAACAGTSGTYSCAGSYTATRTLSGAPLAVTTGTALKVTTASGDAFDLTGTGGLSFKDSLATTSITGNAEGIKALNNGAGRLVITTTGQVVGSTSFGIYAMNTSAAAADLTISTGVVTGATNGIWAKNNGSAILSITSSGAVTGTAGRGIYARNFGTGLSIYTAAVTGGSAGIFAENTGTGAMSVTSTGPVKATAANSTGVYAANANFTDTGLSIITAAVSGGTNGIYGENAGKGALMVISKGAVTGTSGDGIHARNININGTDMTIISTAAVSGGTNGIYGKNAGTGALSITSTGAVTGGTNGAGIFAFNQNGIGSYLTINAAAVSGGTNGIYARKFGTGALSITSTGAVSGATGDGILTQNDAGTDLTINTAAVSGGSTGIRAKNFGTGMTSITTSGSVAGGKNGIYAYNASTAGGLTITTNAAVTGTSLYGIDAQNAGGGYSKIVVNAGSVVQGGVAGIFVDPVAPITITNAGAIQNLSGASDALAIKTGGAPTTITNSGTITGTVALGDLGNSFTNSGTWNTAGGNNTFGAGANSLTNLAGGTIIAASAGSTTPQTTSFNNVGTFTNAGLLNLQNGFAGDQVIIQGDFKGGGTVALDTVLAADGSASDQFVLNGGTVSGTTLLKIVNAGGAGAQTTGNGIAVVVTENGATSSADAFKLSGPVAAGAYQYQLFEGGNAATGGNPNDENWYLRNTLTPTPPDNSDNNSGSDTGGNTDSNTATNTEGNTQTPPPPTGTQLPNYRTEVPVYLAMPELANTVSLAMIGTYDTRMGGDREEIGAAFNPDQQPVIWGRLLGATGQQKPGNQNGLNTSNDFLNGKGPSYGYAYGGLQIGMDLWRKASSDGSHDHVGAYGGFLHAYADVDQVYDVAGSSNNAGNLNMDAYSLGAYWTHFGVTGWYSDVVMQGTWFGNIKGQTANTAMSVQGSAFTASGEAGYPFHFDGGWTVEPQGQIIYQHQSLDSGADLYGITSFNDTNDVRGRIGAKLSRAVSVGADSDATRLTIWARANLWHDFAVNDPSATFADLSGTDPVTLNGSLGGSWAEIDAGISGHITQSISLSGSVFYDHAIDGAQSWSAGGSAGIKSTGVKIGAVMQF